MWMILPLCMVVAFLIWWRLRTGKNRGPPEDDYVNGFDWIDSKKASMGTILAGGKGSGKSWGLGSDLTVKRLMNHEPQLLIETTGGTCDAFLWKLTRLSEALSPPDRKKLFSRVRYYDMSGLLGVIPSCPLYFRLHDSESLYDIAMRPVDLWLRIDPSLTSAPIQGANALSMVASNCGMIAFSLGLSVHETVDMLDNPERFEDEGLFDEAIVRYEEARGAVEWFRNTYMAAQKRGGWGPAEKVRNTSAYRNKLEQIVKNETLRCKYSQLEPLDLDEVDRLGLTVIRDHRHVGGDQQRRFSLMYDIGLIKAWARYRQRTETTMHIYLEELTEYTGMDTQAGSDLFASDLNYLLAVEARNKKIGFVCLLQSFSQISLPMQATLLVGCGNLCIGKQDFESALILAKELFPYEGGHINRWDPVYFSGDDGPAAIDYRPVEFSPAEWQALAANTFAKLPGWSFWVRPVVQEGTVATSLLPMKITRNVGYWPNAEKLEIVRKGLAQGRTKADVLAELAQRLDAVELTPVPENEEFDKVNDDDARAGYLPV